MSSFTATYYYTSWSIYDRQYLVKDLPIEKMPRIAYAFFDARPDPHKEGILIPTSGDPWADFDKRFMSPDSVEPPDSWTDGEPYHGTFGQFKKLKKRHPHFKLVLALFGWTWSSRCSDVYLTPQSRRAFVDGLIGVFKKYPIFDGVCIDHEYLSDDGINYGNEGNLARKEDGKNFVAFLVLLRQRLRDNGMRDYEVNMCCSAAPEKAKAFPIETIHPMLDYLEIMTYDFADGNWKTGNATHHTNLNPTKYTAYSVKGSVDHYLKRGVPPKKLLVGVAAYSRGFGNCGGGLNSPAYGGSPDKDWDTGSVDYKNLPRPGALEKWDREAQATYSYDPAKKIFTSYDSAESVRAKCKYVQEMGLGGVLMWECSADHPVSNPRSLIRTIHESLLVSQKKKKKKKSLMKKVSDVILRRRKES